MSECFGQEHMQIKVLAHGSFHQGNMHRYSHQFGNFPCEHDDQIAGVQCLANSLAAVALTYKKSLRIWNQQDMDMILCQGDMMYKTISSEPRLLQISDIPAYVTVFDKKFLVKWDTEQVSGIQGALIEPMVTKMSTRAMSDAIIMMGDHSGAYACSIHFRRDTYFIFDAHSRSCDTGFPDPNGTSVLLQCDNALSCALYFKHVGKKLKATQFSMWMVSVDKCTEHVAQKTTPTDCHVHQQPSIQHSKKHSNITHTINLTTCATCGYLYQHARDKKMHTCTALLNMKVTFTRHKDINLMCNICKRRFENIYNKETHEELCAYKQAKKETRKLSESCNSCGKVFGNNYNRLMHENVCKKGKGLAIRNDSFICKNCDKTFNNTHNRNRHEDLCMMRSVEYFDGEIHKIDQAIVKMNHKLEVQLLEKQRLERYVKELGPDPNWQKHLIEQELNVHLRHIVTKKKSLTDFLHLKGEYEQRREYVMKSKSKMTDGDRKRKKRKNPEFVSDERKSKRVKRQNLVYNQKENERQQVRRYDVRYGTDLLKAIEIFQDEMSQGPDYKCASCMQTHFKSHVMKVSHLVLKNDTHQKLLKQCVTAHISLEGSEWHVTSCASIESDEFETCQDHKSFDGDLWICRACKDDIKQGLVPKLSTLNKVGFPPKPDELKIYPLEETLISPLLPFMVIRALPICGLTEKFGQKKIIGNVVHVPNAINTTVTELPRNLDNMGTISINLKRKKEYKHSVFTENIRPHVVLTALRYLVQNSSLYQKFKTIGSEWIEYIQQTTHLNRLFVEGHNHDVDDDEEMASVDTTEPCIGGHSSRDTDCEFNDSDTDCEVDDSEYTNVTQGNLDTMLTENIPISVTNAQLQDRMTNLEETCNVDSHRVLNLAPGEGQIPVYREPDAEYLSFGTLFCGQTRPSNKERERYVHTSELFKAEVRHSDPRVWSSISNIFWKTKHLLERRLAGVCIFALRRLVGSRTKGYTAADLCNLEKRNEIQYVDEGFKILRGVRNSPAYFEKAKRKIMAMVRQLTIPTIFFSLSSADTHWPELLRSLAYQVDNKLYTLEDIEEKMSFEEKCRLVASHPALCSRFFHERVQKFIKILLKNPHSPLKQATNYVYRVEFQKRGSPHVHGLLWINDAPQLGVNSREEIINYIDSCISCSLDVSEENKKYVKLQVHRHSKKTCLKKIHGKKVCRFGIPIFPMQTTMILDPLSSEDVSEKEIAMKNLEHIQFKMTNIPDHVQTFDDWLQFIDLSEDDYIKAVRMSIHRPKIFLKRKPTEVLVNAYMKHFLGVWKANHDVQFVLDPYQCVCYICDYMTKSQKGMSELLRIACEEAQAGNMHVKESVRHITNVFINAAESSAQECCYDLLGLLMVDSSVKEEFICTAPLEKRVAVMKSLDELEQLVPHSKDVTYKSNIDRYTMRPRILKDWSLADYVSWIELMYPKKKKQTNLVQQEENEDVIQQEENNGSCQTSDDESENGLMEDSIFPYTMPNGIVLRKRKKQKIIRFVNYRMKADPEEYYRERVLLYTVWRKEGEILQNFSTYEAVFNHHKESIMKQMAIYEPMSAILEEAEELYEQQNQETQNDLPLVGTDSERPDIEEMPPEHQFDIGPSIGLPPLHLEPEVELIPRFLPDNEFYKLIGSLNQKQLEFYTYVVHEATQSKEQVMCALHGGAGTGKSHVIKAIYQGLHRILNKRAGQTFDNERVLLAAPTGKAAYNIKGSTIHRIFYIAANQKMDFKPLSWDLLNTARRKFHAVEWILIDEFSMVGNKMLRFIHLRLQEIKGNNLPFGGLNIICIGDLYQLKPVMQGYIFEQLSEEYGSLATNLWTEHFVIFEIDEIMRQKGDKEFAQLLNRLREGQQTKHDIEILKSRQITQAESEQMSSVPHFFPTKAQRDTYNANMLSKCAGREVIVTAIDSAPSDVSDTVQQQILNAAKNKTDVSSTGNLPYFLTIKVGQVYDITANIAVEDGIINGSECTVRHIEDGRHNDMPQHIWVQFADDAVGKETRRMSDPKYFDLLRKRWTPIPLVQRTFVVKRSQTVKRQQFPLRLSSGRTIHVSQSSTYKEIVVDMKTQTHPPKHFFEHMHYVALSRCTSLDGLHIVNINEEMIKVSSKVYDYLHNHKKNMILTFEPPYAVQDHLRIAYNNVCSIKNKWSAISGNHLLKNADIVIFAETWLSEHANDAAYRFDDFVCHRMDSTVLNARRGILVYIKHELDVLCLRSENHLLEACVLCVPYDHGVLQLIGIYKPPTTSTKQLFCELNKLFSKCDMSKPILLIGDFNIDILSEQNSRFLSSMSVSYGLQQLIKEPTTTECTAIDLVFTNVNSVTGFPLTNTWSNHHTLFTYIPKT